MSGYCDDCGNTLCICPVDESVQTADMVMAMQHGYVPVAQLAAEQAARREVELQRDAAVQALVEHLEEAYGGLIFQLEQMEATAAAEGRTVRDRELMADGHFRVHDIQDAREQIRQARAALADDGTGVRGWSICSAHQQDAPGCRLCEVKITEGAGVLAGDGPGATTRESVILARIRAAFGPSERAARSWVRSRSAPGENRMAFMCLLCSAWAYVEDGELSIQHDHECLFAILRPILDAEAAEGPGVSAAEARVERLTDGLTEVTDDLENLAQQMANLMKESKRGADYAPRVIDAMESVTLARAILAEGEADGE